LPTTRFALPAAAAVLAVVLAGCAPEPQASPEDPASSPAASASASPAGSADPSPTSALPQECGEIYSDDMRAQLESEVPPLNDPGITMLPTQNATLLELIDTLPTLRCTWGPPGERGLATSVSLVDTTQAATVSDELAAAGFGCEEADGATICRIEQRGVTLDDTEYLRGETHALREGLWVATGWLNIAPDGYSEDILDTVGG